MKLLIDNYTKNKNFTKTKGQPQQTTKARWEASPKLTIKTQEQLQWRHYGVFTANPKHTITPAPVPSLPTLSGQMPNGM